MNVLDLFAGIGGFSLGLQRAGMQTTAFCEIDPYCQQVLRKHWPEIVCYPDISKLCRHADDSDPESDSECIGTDEFIDRHGCPDVITGGFPCQDISLGHTWRTAEGIAGARSSKWWEMHRVIRELNPAWVIAENVDALRSRGLETVLGSLAEIGYDAQWHRISARDVGARHRRDRIWIVAHPARKRVERLRAARIKIAPSLAEPFLPLRRGNGEWEIEPDLRRANDGVPRWMDRLRCVGNSCVPQIPEIIGRAIMSYSGSA